MRGSVSACIKEIFHYSEWDETNNGQNIFHFYFYFIIWCVCVCDFFFVTVPRFFLRFAANFMYGECICRCCCCYCYFNCYWCCLPMHTHINWKHWGKKIQDFFLPPWSAPFCFWCPSPSGECFFHYFNVKYIYVYVTCARSNTFETQQQKKTEYHYLKAKRRIIFYSVFLWRLLFSFLLVQKFPFHITYTYMVFFRWLVTKTRSAQPTKQNEKNQLNYWKTRFTVDKCTDDFVYKWTTWKENEKTDTNKT